MLHIVTDSQDLNRFRNVDMLVIYLFYFILKMDYIVLLIFLSNCIGLFLFSSA